MTDSRRESATHAASLLVHALRAPEQLPELGLRDWDVLLRVARSKRLLGRLECDLQRLGLLDAVPPPARDQLRAAANLVRHRQTLLTWELDRVLWALDGTQVPVLALKGVAYVVAGIPSAGGRYFADLDLLVPESDIAAVEQRLLERGWLKKRLSPYDDRYYRVWMHEIPPLRHRERENEIDIHHRLLPRTSRLNFDPSRLFEQARPVADSRASVLAPHDMVLHALVHLFLEGDPQEGLRLRDLVDVADLLDHFGSEPEFWEGLVPRAETFGLGRPLYYGLRFAGRLLNCAIPQSVILAAEHGRPMWPLRVAMDWLIPLALLPGHPDHPLRRAALARWLLYIRSHWLRMPFGLLLRHLLYKGWLRIRGVPKRMELTPQELKRM